MRFDKFGRSRAEPHFAHDQLRLPFSYTADGDNDLQIKTQTYEKTHFIDAANKSYVDKTLQNIASEEKTSLDVGTEALNKQFKTNT